MRALRASGDRVGARIVAWGPEVGDGLLYGLSAVFAAATAAFSTLSLYRVWGEIAAGPYLAAALASLVLGRRARAGSRVPVPAGAAGTPPAASAPASWPRWPWPRAGSRAWLFLVVLVGAMLVPLATEVTLRSDGSATSTQHVQPEVVVIQQAADRLARGEEPYHAVVRDGRVVSAVPGEPGYDAFFPYLPLMAVFGLPGSTHAPMRLTDARIFFSLVTLVVVALAVLLCRAPPEPRIRTLQFLVVLPTAALPLATGGDDMPIVAFLLLAMVLAQRRRPVLSGLALGVVSSMKFTAWPLAALALLAARDRQGRRAVGRMVLGMLAVAGPAVLPFALRNEQAFVVNVILFPLGLSGVASPAASALPGHLLVTAFPSLHRALPLAVAAVGGVVLVRRLLRRPPDTASAATTLAGWVMLVAICLAPATRVGYLLYPVDFFVWAAMLRAAEAAEPLPEPEAEEAPMPDGALAGAAARVSRRPAPRTAGG